MRFVHAADIHLGKPFGNFDEDTRAALKSARLDAVHAIGALAISRDAEFVVIAGDTFDAEAPPSRLVKRALDAMAAFPDLTWIWMPGNHDSLAAIDLWERLERDKPDNVILATTPETIEIGEDVAILPAPPAVRAPGYDLTEWMGSADTGTRIRIGLAHGGVTHFGSHDDMARCVSRREHGMRVAPKRTVSKNTLRRVYCWLISISVVTRRVSNRYHWANTHGTALKSVSFLAMIRWQFWKRRCRK
jgi:hypothetical protein